MNTDMGLVSGISFNLVLSEPIICIIMQDDSASMGVYMNSVIVLPDLTRTD